MKNLSLIILLIMCFVCFKVFADINVDGTAKIIVFQMDTGKGEGRVLTSDINGTGTWRALSAIGDITEVNAGYGLSGGGNSGSLTLYANQTILQNRVSGSCPIGSSIRQINQNGTIVCENDDFSNGTISGVVGASGISGGGSSGNVTLSGDTTYLQKRVLGTCTTSISGINQDGNVTCAASVADNLGDHRATQNIRLNNFYLSNDGGNEGISIDNIGNVTVTGFKMTSGAGTNKVLTSNSSGVGSWEALAIDYWQDSGSDIDQTNSGKVIITRNLKLASSGIIYLDAERFIHRSGTDNTFIGGSSGSTSLSGQKNTGLGRSVTQQISGGSYNTASGNVALQNNIGGLSNTILGAWAFAIQASGSNNTGLGTNTGRFNDNGSGNVFLGSGAGGVDTSSHRNMSNKLYITSSADIPPTSDTPLIYGDFSSSKINIGTMTLTEKLNVAGTVKTIGFKMATGAVFGRILTSNASGVGSWAYPPVSGGGSAGFLAKFTPDSTHIGNSLIYDSGTNVGIGTITPGYRFQVRIDAVGEGHVNPDGSWGATPPLPQGGGTGGEGKRLEISDSSIESHINLAAAWSSSSDIRLKKNVTTLKDSLSKVLKIRGVRYDWVSEPDSESEEGRHIGFIAQELEQEFPELVDTGKDGYKSVRYAMITPVLVEAIKELKAETDEIEKRVEALEKNR